MIIKSNLVFALVIAVALFLANSCKSDDIKVEKSGSDKGSILLERTIKAHGGESYNQASYQFEFRGKTYTFKNDHPSYEYTVSSTKDEQKIVDVLDNDGLTRKVNGEYVNLSKKDNDKYFEALNSVIYFVTLPSKLQDPAVNHKHAGQANIKDQDYEVLHITFEEENGGKDHDDNFYYWINSETDRIDYLAYNYKVNGGGVRFRSAFNTRDVGGIIFQDYINYKAPLGTPLAELPSLYEEEKLEQLSLIKTEQIREFN